MKWFKHQSDMIEDPKVRRLVRKHGAVGYAVYNLVLERIVKRLDASSPLPDLEEQAEDIADMLRMDTLKVEEVMWTCIEAGMFDQDEVTGRVVAHKVYKYLMESQTRSGELKKMITAYGRNMQHETVTGSNMLQQQEEDKELDTEEKRREEKRPYGPGGVVHLTEDEHATLCDRFGNLNVDALIASFEDYTERTGKSYSSHYRTLLNWGKRDGMKPPDPEPALVATPPDDFALEVRRRRRESA